MVRSVAVHHARTIYFYIILFILYYIYIIIIPLLGILKKLILN